MKSHRGLSAVIGTVFLIAVVVGALSYVSYSLDMMGNFSQSLVIEESRQKDKQSEAFEISSIDVTGADKLDGVIKNTGEVPVKLTTLYVDEQGVNDVVNKTTINEIIAPGNIVNIRDLVDVDMDPTKGYNMKIVTSRGEVQEFYVNSLANENVYMKLVAAPSVIPSTFESTLFFTVVNNMSNGNHLYNVTPIMNDTGEILVEDSAGFIYEQKTGPIPPSYDSLGPGEVAVFSYTYELSTDSDLDAKWFNVTLANANVGNEALASVSVKTVPLATDAGSALTSFGLSDTSTSQADVMYFHDSSSGDTPNNEYPMDGSSPNSAAITRSPNGNTLEFISASMTTQTIVDVGEYTAALNYYSSPVPLGIPEPSFAFMFDVLDCGKDDRQCDMINLFDDDKGLKEKDSKPDFFSSGGPDEDGFFDFSSDEWFEDDWNVDGGTESDYTEPGNYPDSTAFWIRMESNGDSYQPILRFGDDDESQDDCIMFSNVSGGYVRYTVGDNNCNNPVYCDSDSTIDDSTWHHIVGVRINERGCLLYVDAVAQSDTHDLLSTVDDGHIDVDTFLVGSDDDDGGNDPDVDIASIFHWNNDELTADQVEELYYTNYGTNGTRLYMTVEVFDELGLTLMDTIIPETKIELPFHDPSYNSDEDTNGKPWWGLYTGNGTDGKYQQANMTATDAIGYTLEATERLKLTLDWKDEDNQNLPINIMWDDSSGWSLPEGPSYVQTPTPTPRWPTYLTFNFDDPINYLAYNEGPGGIWFVYSGTRLVLTSLDGISSYAAVPYTVNATTQPTPVSTYSEITADQDSIYIPATYYAEIDFYQLQSPPAPNSGPPSANEVPTGDYDGALYLQGYDETGETFKKTVDLGLIHIVGNP